MVSAHDEDIHEVYSINGYVIKRKLASQKPDFKSPGKFADRRSNFMGYTMKTMIEADNYYATLLKAYDQDESQYDPVMEAYKLKQEAGSPIVSGRIWEMLVTMSEALNFTVEAYVRKDRIWGTVKVQL